jgi:hypothetical protein
MFYDVKISNEQINPNYKEWLEKKGKNLDCQLSVTVSHLNPIPAFRYTSFITPLCLS